MTLLSTSKLSNGDHQKGAENGGISNRVPLLEKPIYSPRKLRIVCIGAGYAGLILAYYLREMKMEDFIDLQIYEKNHDVGGTWLENRYPGVACDVPAHTYTFPFEPNPDWTSFYAKGPEIWEYIKRTTVKYNLDRDVQFNTKITDTVWDNISNKWKIKADMKGSVVTDEAEILVNGSGILNHWKWPDIRGLETFKGELLHSAKWDENCDWAGKRVAVIGNGSSAIQIVPQIQKTASKVVNYIRNATWISANFSAEFAREGRNFQYTEAQKRAFRENPEVLFEVRRKLEHSMNTFFYACLNDSPEQVELNESFPKLMRHRLNGRNDLMEKLIPKWKVGCRRLTPGDGYLEALQESNAKCEFDPIVRIAETGIKTAKGLEEFDIIVAATGFDVSFKPRWNVKGVDGYALEDWSDSPEAYFGICAPGMPNYFMFNGPNCPIGHGSLMYVMKWTAEYILRWAKKIATEDISSATVKREAVDDYNFYSQEFLKRTVWADDCRSWYKNGKIDGKITAMYAGSVLHYREILEQIRGEDFDMHYNSKNKFRYMGNGLTRREERGEDLSFYLSR